MRLHYYHYIQETEPNYVHETISGNGYDKTIKVIRLDEDERTVYDADLIEKRKVEFDDLIGFSKIWKAVRSSGKPLIGHNCFLDLIFTFEHFDHRISQSLPAFKKKIRSNFPKYEKTINILEFLIQSSLQVQ